MTEFWGSTPDLNVIWPRRAVSMATGQPPGTNLFVGVDYIYQLPGLPVRLLSRRRGDGRSAAGADYLSVRG